MEEEPLRGLEGSSRPHSTDEFSECFVTATLFTPSCFPFIFLQIINPKDIYGDERSDYRHVAEIMQGQNCTAHPHHMMVTVFTIGLTLFPLKPYQNTTQKVWESQSPPTSCKPWRWMTSQFLRGGQHSIISQTHATNNCVLFLPRISTAGPTTYMI